jgi:DNA polymerase I-like protein with 3'-5' exonuclease and polymerase domains
MKAYHRGVPFAKETMDALSEFANMYGYNKTLLGRRTRFNTWEPATWGVKGQPLPYHAAIDKYGVNIKRAYLYRTLNYTLQGSSADMMKKAMVECYQAGIFDVTGVPRLTVHDELDFSVAEVTPAFKEAMREMHHIMQTCIPLRVPVICDLDVGPNWGDVEETDTMAFLMAA